MAYEKKNLYPSALKPGVYPDGTTKELGLNSDELENISLGNWNSIVKNDRIAMSEQFRKYDNQQAEASSSLYELPVSFLPLVTGYPDPSRLEINYSAINGLNHRFEIQIFGYYLNTKTLSDAGFGNGDGGGTDFPDLSQYGMPGFSGTAPALNLAENGLGTNEYIYYSYDPTKYLFNQSNKDAGGDSIATLLSIAQTQGYTGPIPEFDLDTYVDLNWYSQEYVDALRASVEFRNFTYEITQGKTNLSNSEIKTYFAIETTYAEVSEGEYSAGIGNMLHYHTDPSRNPLIGRAVQIQDNHVSSPFALGIRVASEDEVYPTNGNLYKIVGELGANADPPYLTQASYDEATFFPTYPSGETFFGKTQFLSYIASQINELNTFLLANIFYLDSNPTDGDDTYGSLSDQNPLKIYFSENNQQELEEILKKELVMYAVPLDDTFDSLVPEGVESLNYNNYFPGRSGVGVGFETKPSTFHGGGNYEVDDYHVGNLHATVKLRIIFDRPTTYFNLNDDRAPQDYDDTDRIPSKYFISQHPTNSTFYDGNSHEYGYWAGSATQIQDSTEPLQNIDNYRRPSYFTASPLTLDDSAAVIISSYYLNSPQQIIQNFPIFLIDDRDENGKYNAYIPKASEFPGINWQNIYLNVGQEERLAYLTDVLGYPNFSWPPSYVDEYVPDYTSQQIQLQFDIFLSSLTSLDNQTTFPNIDEISDSNHHKIDFGRSDYTVNTPDYLVHAYYGDLESPIIKSSLPTDDKLLYFDKKNIHYFPSSYPVKVNVAIDLFGVNDFANEAELITLDDLEQIRQDYLLGGAGENLLAQSLLEDVQYAAQTPENSIYRFQVVQWGDEKNLLSDEAIENSYFFEYYNQEEYPNRFDYLYKKTKYDQTFKSKNIIERDDNGNLRYNLFSHQYTTPGPKSIKIVVYRYTKNNIILIESSLITKNININDGLLLSQDFSIFGGSEYVFLPLRSGMSGSNAIIGGLDSDSKYNNSVEKIKKDDNFIKVDYLNRASSRIFIDDFNDGFYGNAPGQLDLGLTRVYKKPSDLYSFLNADVDSFVDTQFPSTHIYDQGNRIQTLPINSSATDIFIDDENCVIDINSENMEYLTIPNKVGTQDKSVLIGDYKVNQPKDGKVSKQGNMKIPKVERNKNKQAF